MTPTESLLWISASYVEESREAGRHLTREEIKQLKKLTSGRNAELLRKLFLKGELNPCLTKETLLAYRKLAQNAINRGIDRAGVQQERLRMIEEALRHFGGN